MSEHEQLVAALREVLRDNSVDAPMLIQRVPFICEDIRGIKKSMEGIENKLDQKFVTKDSFQPVQKIVFGLVALILTAVVVALLALVVSK